ncbi:universal stress protein [Aquimarina brevivitae]|uniref:Nucleotide-binding universal stress UspA family protein n=1 Tax=Aquimarina brevivitae TaxID=323412 RepID=A0A4Q7PI96_9FLAO|nr:universal stress protein [Aquimarina brevivitae]RZS99698.1 nucleotide-binding universal stress UspA family protein [Aquimarina brevivitae]
MKTILVPTDFSHNAYHALLYATRLFKNQKCHFVLLNTFLVKTPILTSRLNTEKGEQLYQQLSLQSKEQLTEVYHNIIRDTEGCRHTFEMVSISQELTETIQKTAATKNVDLVIMGTKGATGAKEIFMGSNTVSTIKKLKNTPVLAVPLEFETRTPSKIAFASDFKRPYKDNELAPLHHIASLFKAAIDVIYVNEDKGLDVDQKNNLKIFKQTFQEFDLTIHEIEKSKYISKEIDSFIKQDDFDLLAMIYYQHSLMESITKEPVINKLGFRTNIPFLVMQQLR